MWGLFLSCAAAVLLVTRVAVAEPLVQTVHLPQGIRALHRAGPSVVVEDGQGRTYRLSVAGGRAALSSLESYAPPAPPRRPGMLPDGEVATGRGAVAEAWLTGPTERYRHGALGDMVEASGLSVRLSDGRGASLTLGPESVFEDRTVRLADLDGDGREELIVVRTYLDRGAAVSVFRVGPGGIEPVAESEPLGRPFLWLNPIGVADFDGDGRPEIAVVATPHIGGILKIYGLKGRRLVEEISEPGFSNHVNGTRELGMAAILDLNGDRVPDLLVPSADRERLLAVTVNRGEITYLWELRNRAPVATALALSDGGGESPSLVYGLADGTAVVLSHFVVPGGAGRRP